MNTTNLSYNELNLSWKLKAENLERNLISEEIINSDNLNNLKIINLIVLEMLNKNRYKIIHDKVKRKDVITRM